MGAACPSAGVAALNGSFVEFDGSGALGQQESQRTLAEKPSFRRQLGLQARRITQGAM